MSQLWRNVRLTFRQLANNPGFTITAVATLALGIGSTAAIFSLAHAVMLRPLPFPQPDRLVWMQNVDHSPGMRPNSPEPLSYPDFFDWRERSQAFEGMASYRGTNVTVTGVGQPRQLQACMVSANFFRVLGVQPLPGRDFLAAEDQPGAHAVMLSHELWQSMFGGAPDISGRSVTLDGIGYVVAGVIPAGLEFPVSNPLPALWITMARDAEGTGKPMSSQRGADLLDIVGRLKPGVSANQARAELDVIASQLAVQYPDTNKPFTSTFVLPMLEHSVGDYRPALRVLFAAVVCLLLIACANVAGLLLVHASRRSPEIAVRAALGASRAEITAQILVESVLLSLCGGALGILFSTWTLSALLHYVPKNIPRLDQITVDGPVLAFVTTVSVLTGILFGVTPAWRASRLDPASALRDLGRSATSSHSRSRLHNWIVIAETAIGLVLLAGSGLLIRSYVRVMQVNPGFDPRHVLTASLSLSDKSYSQARKLQFYDRVLSRIAVLPGVQSVAAGYPLPLAEGSIGISFQIEGRPTNPGDSPTEPLAVVTPGFFRTMRIPVIAGREFSARDDGRGRPVIIVNQQFAQKYFPGENPVGKHVKSDLSDGTMNAPMREVIGVVGNIKRKTLTRETEPMYYLPFAQAIITSPSLCIRTAGDPAPVAGAVRTEVERQDQNVPLYRVRTAETLLGTAASEPRFQMVLVTSFAVLALLLSAVGLYAVLSYMVAQRTLELGLRMALGAQPIDVLNWVVRRGVVMAGVGTGIGLALSMVLTRYMGSLLFGVKPLDVLTLTAASVALLLVSAIASSAPALRASRLDPMQALKDQ